MKETRDVIHNVHVLLTELRSCSLRRDLNWGRRIHEKAMASRDDTNRYVATALIRMYAKCGSMVEAHRVFDSIPKPAAASWTALLLGYADSGKGHLALQLFSRMKAYGYAPDPVSYVAALKACTSLAVHGDGTTCLRLGREIHLEIGCHSDRYVKCTLIDMYAKGGSMLNARLVFDSMHQPDVVAWTALLLGYAENGEGYTALELFSKMKAVCQPNTVTYVAVLKACVSVVSEDVSRKKECLQRGRLIHSEIQCGLDHQLQNTLVDMYAKCGSMIDARRVFGSIRTPTVVSWTALIMGYADNGEGDVALDMFSRMSFSGCIPDSVTYIAALKACTSLALSVDVAGKVYILERGRDIHSRIGSNMDVYVQNTLIDMYSKCGSMYHAREVFDSIQRPSIVSWNVMLLGYAENGEGLVVLDLFSRMKSQDYIPNSVTYVAVFKACGFLGALFPGRKYHSEVHEFTSHVVTCLVDFYAKCGSIVEARKVFDCHVKTRDTTTWTALLAGYGSLGDSDTVIDLFEAMQDEGIRPDAVTFLCLLLSCSHAGSVEKARVYLEAMTHQYRVAPNVIHFNCLLDVLGRANRLNEAIAMIQKMPCSPDGVTWMVLLGACRKWKNVELGRMAFQYLVVMGKPDSAHALMANIYGSRGMWDEQEKVLEMRNKFRLQSEQLLVASCG